MAAASQRRSWLTSQDSSARTARRYRRVPTTARQVVPRADPARRCAENRDSVCQISRLARPNPPTRGWLVAAAAAAGAFQFGADLGCTWGSVRMRESRARKTSAPATTEIEVGGGLGAPLAQGLVLHRGQLHGHPDRAGARHPWPGSTPDSAPATAPDPEPDSARARPGHRLRELRRCRPPRRPWRPGRPCDWTSSTSPPPSSSRPRSVRHILGRDAGAERLRIAF